MKQKVTMQRIADKLQMSKSLVSKALSNQPGVSEETKERVRLESMKMGYRVNTSILSVPSSRTGNVAVLVPREDLSDFEYWGSIFGAIEKELSKHRFSMILAGIDTTLPADDSLPNCITDRKVDGALILGLVPMPYILAVQVTQIPIVLVDPMYLGLKLDHVLAENFYGGYDAAKYLLARNHRNIGFVGDTAYAATFAERYRGFCAAVQEYGGESGESINVCSVTESKGSADIPLSHARMEAVLDGGDRPTAFVCANDPVAFTVLQMMEHKGLSCPEDVSLIGFDNVHKCDWVTPGLTSVDADKDTMGSRSVQLLLRKMNEPGLRPEHVLIMTQIVERSSVRQ